MAKETNFYMFVAGFSMGAVGALLLAPAAGIDTRNKVWCAANDASDRLKEGWAKGNEFIDGIHTKVNDTVAASKRTVDEVVGQSKDVVRTAGRQLEMAGQRLQQI